MISAILILWVLSELQAPAWIMALAWIKFAVNMIEIVAKIAKII